ncbi:HotDog domain-containing protein [Sporodiniella umbellata]|nr:HotDog domain-containing protein [Sporodiniella umbellata]
MFSLPQSKEISFPRSFEEERRFYSPRASGFWADKNCKESPLSDTVDTQPYTLLEKKMSDSYMEKYLAFKSDPVLLEEYIDSNRKIRMGKILEDLDDLGASVAYKHVHNRDLNAPNITMVTASMERLDLFLPEAEVQNYKISGHVTFVGSSSLEVSVKMDICQEPSRSLTANPPKALTPLTKNTLLAVRFIMVALDSSTQLPTKINSLVPTSEEEKDAIEMARQRKDQMARKSNGHKKPDTFDLKLVQNLLEDDDTNKVKMSDSGIESNVFMFPQYRNVQNHIFGGYLMRQAYELAFSNACLYMKSFSPFLHSIDKIIFKKPVLIGSLLNLKSTVILTDDFTMQIRVVAELVHLEKERELTNEFYFTFVTESKPQSLCYKKQSDGLAWLEAKRRQKLSILLRNEVIETMK